MSNFGIYQYHNNKKNGSGIHVLAVKQKEFYCNDNTEIIHSFMLFKIQPNELIDDSYIPMNHNYNYYNYSRLFPNVIQLQLVDNLNCKDKFQAVIMIVNQCECTLFIVLNLTL